MGDAGINGDHQIERGDQAGSVVKIAQIIAEMGDPAEESQHLGVVWAQILLYCNPVGILGNQAAPHGQWNASRMVVNMHGIATPGDADARPIGLAQPSPP